MKRYQKHFFFVAWNFKSDTDSKRYNLIEPVWMDGLMWQMDGFKGRLELI